MTKRQTVLALATACTLLVASSASAGWDEGVAAFRAGNYAQAIAEFQQFVEERTEEEALEKGYQMLAQSLLRGGKAKESIAAFQKHLELKPGDVGSQVYLGQAYYKSGMPRECVATLNRLNVGSLPAGHQIQVYQMRSASYARLGNTRAAAADLGKVADLKSDDAKTRFEYGRLLHSDAQLDAAIRAYERAISMDGSNAEWKKTLVNALKIKGRSTQGSAKAGIYAKAENVARSLVGSSASFDNLLLLGEVQMGGKNYGAAASTFQQAISKRGNDWHPHFYLGQSYGSLERYNDAEAPLNTALTVAPGDAEKRQIQDYLGFVLSKQNKYGPAIAAYELAGNAAGAARVRENQQIAQENREADEHNRNIEELQRQREELRRQLEELPGAANEPPPR
ncbi:MAG: tetratricopeptide repeat protein [Acidobacteria bacterium]|nr:tetratricopeptide repeat protein [Acidobacteriota bacterium]